MHEAKVIDLTAHRKKKKAQQRLDAMLAARQRHPAGKLR